MRLPLALSVLLATTACGGDDGGGTAVDAPSSTVARVQCGGATIAGTVTAFGFAFTPMATTISVGQVVQFMMSATHNAISDEGLFTADFNATVCYRFDAARTYPFHCGPHGFTGTIVVQ